MEAFPEHSFSMEELQIHNFLCEWLQDAHIKREKIKFVNPTTQERYFPDWIVDFQGHTYIIEYFGLYHSNKYKGYREKSNRKITFFQNLDGYIFFPIFPEDFKGVGFDGIKNKFNTLL
ncbi:hypothetical protein [Bacillus sp. m3-13]|uniref:hypothetical protein n=1 Tax=Bacillus sp. m3-13 TaxID=406124 RepID=UPI0001E89D6B|nr:hypothetical protein [Bacillus sp. m3-13]